LGSTWTCVDARVANLGMPKSVSLRTHSCTLCANLSSGVHLEMMQLVKWMCLKWNRFTYTYWGGSEFIFQIFCPPLIWRIHLYFHEVVILDYKIHIWNIETVVWLTVPLVMTNSIYPWLKQPSTEWHTGGDSHDHRKFVDVTQINVTPTG